MLFASVLELIIFMPSCSSSGRIMLVCFMLAIKGCSSSSRAVILSSGFLLNLWFWEMIVLPETRVDKVFCIGRDLIVQIWQNLCCCNLMHDFELVRNAIVKWRLSDQHFIYCSTKAPNVTEVIDSFLFNDLRCHSVHRANEIFFSSTFFKDSLCRSEIRKFADAIMCGKNVCTLILKKEVRKFTFDIPVHYMLLMEIGKPLKYLFWILPNQVFIKSTIVSNLLVNTSTRHIFHKYA